MRAQVGLGECDGEGGVGGEVENRIALAPVSGGVSYAMLKTMARHLLNNGDVDGCSCAGTVNLFFGHRF